MRALRRHTSRLAAPVRGTGGTRARGAAPRAAAIDALMHTDLMRLGAADVLSLQSTVGNQEVLQRLAVQRKDTGLKEKGTVSAFASDAVTYFKDPGNKDKPLNEYATHIMSLINADLKTLGSEECKFSFDGSGVESGSFFRVDWNVKINTAKFSSRAGITKTGELTIDEAAEVADTLYHECRHSEQYFRIARMIAGESTEKTVDKIAAEIVTKTAILNSVALAAAAVPLKASKENKQLLAEAKDWQSIAIGVHESYKGNINDWIAETRSALALAQGVSAANLDKTKTDLDAQIGAWKSATRGAFVDTHLATTEAIKDKGKMDELVVKHLTAIKKALAKVNAAWTVVTDGWASDSNAKKLGNVGKAAPALDKLADEVYAAYRDHLHEKDAWETGNKAGAAFRELANKKKKKK